MELTLYYTYRDQPEQLFQVSGNEGILGRPKNIPIHLDLSPDLKVSRPHARIFYNLSAWWVEDLHSKYGTMLNGNVITQAMTLSPGDTIVQEIDCVVGMSAKIGDAAALRFAGGFYRALGYGRSVQTAFELGRNEIDLTGLDEGAIPKLLVKPGVNAADITFI